MSSGLSRRAVAAELLNRSAWNPLPGRRVMQLVADIFAGFFNDAREWSRGRHWPMRLLLWLWLAWLAFHYTRDAAYSGLIGGLNLGVHEFGHLICSPFGQFINVLGGSLVQCLAPLISL